MKRGNQVFFCPLGNSTSAGAIFDGHVWKASHYTCGLFRGKLQVTVALHLPCDNAEKVKLSQKEIAY